MPLAALALQQDPFGRSQDSYTVQCVSIFVNSHSYGALYNLHLLHRRKASEKMSLTI